MNKVILDASALLALINNEKGASIIEPLIGTIIMSSVNITEVAGKVYDILGNENEEQCKLSIEPFVHSIIEFDKTQCYIAASLKNYTQHKGLSLGDRACLALGIQLNLPVYTADKVWAELDLPSVKIKLIR
ncbi:MAG: type II toxin-antitoxin system VapC family toxin [Rickettsiaceae bacterium]|nr:type II toxin-antitoxin system VapC family toxin [Rickettsiaceae bacterium]